MMEFRIYYECLEQAEYYMKPLMEDAMQRCDTRAKIQLVRKINRITGKPGDSCFAAIGALVTPDLLLTAVTDEREYPLILVEFSEAVTTEDHELQKIYGACAAFFADIFYLKISGQKKSDHVFGGASYNPYSTPRIFADNMGYHGFIYDEWQTNIDSGSLVRGPCYLSCPPFSELTRDVVFVAVKNFLESADGWFCRAIKECQKHESYCSYIEKTNCAGNAESLLKEWENRMLRNEAKSRFQIKKNSIAAKINRFSHAMDPDRGILMFIALAFSKTHKIYGTYALQRARTENMKTAVSDICELRKRLRTALNIDGAPGWFAENLIDLVDHASDMDTILNFSDIFSAHAEQLTSNKVISVLAYFLDGMYLGHNGPLVAWKKRKLMASGENLYDSLKNTFGFKKFYPPVRLQKVGHDATEDEVTYALVHDVLRPCGFHIVSVSYPGAQGGTPILPQPDMGKAQPREYIDAIAAIDGNILLNESKEKFTKSAIDSDCRKLLDYKSNSNKQEALRTALLKLNCLNRDGRFQEIWVGVSFSVDAAIEISWKPDIIDFMFILIDRRVWKIGMFSNSLAEYISSLRGCANFPEMFEPDNGDQEQGTSLC